MKKLVLFICMMVLATACFAQETWQFKQIIETWQDMAGKYRVKVLISNGKEEETSILKFQKLPTKTEILNEIQKICNFKNNPSKPEPTIEELKEENKQLKAEVKQLQEKIIQLEIK